MDNYSQHTEIDRIYSLVIGQGYRSIAITACNAGEGVSTIATALAQRLLLSGHSALLVDLNLYRPSLIPLLEIQPVESSPGLFEAPQLVARATNQAVALTGVAAPTGKEVLVKLRRPGVLERCIERWQQEFDVVILDTSPINRVNANNLPTERAAGACEATLLVALARHTTQAQVCEGVRRLACDNAKLVGTVLNDRFNPPLKSELLRQLNRFSKSRGWLGKRLERLISQSPLLSLDV